MTTSINTPPAPIKLISKGTSFITLSDVPIVVSMLYGTSTDIPNNKVILVECSVYSPNDQTFQVGLTNDFPASYLIATALSEKARSTKFTIQKAANGSDFFTSFVSSDTTGTVTGMNALSEALGLYLVVSGTEFDELYVSWVAYEVG